MFVFVSCIEPEVYVSDRILAFIGCDVLSTLEEDSQE